MNLSEINNQSVSEISGRSQQAVFHAYSTASTALVTPGTVLGPLTIANPTGASVPVAARILSFALVLGAVPTAGNEVTIQLATSQDATLSATSSTNTEVVNAQLSSAPGHVVAYSSGTSSAATKGFRNVGYLGEATTSVTSVMVGIEVDQIEIDEANGQHFIEVNLAGSVILTPGTFVTVNGIGTPGNFSVVCGFTYAEVPLS